MVQGLRNRDVGKVMNNLYNFMESTTFRLEPKVKDIKNELQELGTKGVLMSGSGATMFVLNRKKKYLENIVSQLNGAYYTVLTKIL